ncbi:hypothetical protein FRC10_003154 [Ceratobasidium sp. 414]|nr:hypothetical protein FRC10_003154 [Ceratobasidium sp. 414]
MPQPPGPPLPVELFQLILEFVETPSTVSLVSRQVHQLAFPLVHHTLEISRATRAEEFTDLVLAEDEKAPLRISQALRSLLLRMDFHLSGSLIRLRRIIPKLANLEHLIWNGLTCPRDSNLFTDFQFSCPKLRFLALGGGGEGDGITTTTEDYTRMFGFRNLTYIEIGPWYTCTAGSPGVVPASLINMIRSSPALTTLKLQVPVHKKIPNRLDMDQFFKTMDTTSPCLRHFEVQTAQSLVEWGSMFDIARGPNYIRSFFQNHPHIETLVIDWLPTSEPRATSQVIQGMFPALRHLTGSDSFCAIVANSDVRLQLESLAIVVARGDGKVANVSTKLPQLRHLGFRVHTVNSASRQKCEGSLQEYLRAAPKLVSLDIRDIYTSIRWDVS